MMQVDLSSILQAGNVEAQLALAPEIGLALNCMTEQFLGVNLRQDATDTDRGVAIETEEAVDDRALTLVVDEAIGDRRSQVVGAEIPGLGVLRIGADVVAE